MVEHDAKRARGGARRSLEQRRTDGTRRVFNNPHNRVGREVPSRHEKQKRRKEEMNNTTDRRQQKTIPGIGRIFKPRWKRKLVDGKATAQESPFWWIAY